ncbi:MAG: hypothetical protein Q8O89_08865 [Nanoarchaeota archaeon]|nr:hypothetical protein [Nanoarchaeota archaeon]
MRKQILLFTGLVCLVLFVAGCQTAQQQASTVADDKTAADADTGGADSVKRVFEKAGEAYCDTNTDCIPKPDCHPMECLNKKYADRYTKPEICTQVILSTAAYTPQDCSCMNHNCINDNLQ